MKTSYLVSFFDGPISGATFELAEVQDKIVIVSDANAVHRYECDQMDTETIGTVKVCKCRMVCSPLPDEFDAEVCGLLSKTEELEP